MHAACSNGVAKSRLYNLVRDQHSAHVQHSNFDNESKWCRNVSAMTTHDACSVQPQVRFKSCKPWCMIHHDPTLPPPVFPIHASWRMWSHLLFIGHLKINLANMMCSFDHNLMHWGSNVEKYGNILNDLWNERCDGFLCATYIKLPLSKCGNLCEVDTVVV